jgi:hypothetical protein
MRYLVALWAVLTLAACSTAQGPRSGPPAGSTNLVQAAELQDPTLLPVVQFLIRAAAADFHAHSPPDPTRFRDVRLGHVLTARGEAQYMLCGEFLAAGAGGKAEWTRFATIRTSDYEQWLGAQAAGFCDGPAVVWDKAGNLSNALQVELQSLH